MLASKAGAVLRWFADPVKSGAALCFVSRQDCAVFAQHALCSRPLLESWH